MRYDDDPGPPRYHRPTPTPSAGGGALIAWALVLVLALGLVAAGVGLWFAWPKLSPLNDPTAGARPTTPGRPPDAEEREAIDLFANVKDAVVNVDTVVFRRNFDRSVDAVQAGTGSGFVWDDEGRVVTNYHVVQDAIRNDLALRVVLADRSEWKAAVVGIAPDYDLAVLKINAPATQLKKIAVGTSKDLQVGQKVYALGNPFGLSLTLTKGIVSALDREIESPARTPIPEVIQTDAPINPGNSGGPLLDKDGRLIGVNTAIATAQEGGGSVGIGFAIPVDIVNRVVPELIRSGKLLKPDMGVRLVNQVAVRRAGYDRGVMIGELDPTGPAAKAGLRGVVVDPRTREVTAGDMILKVDEQEVRTNAEFEQIMYQYKPGDRVTLTVERDGGTFKAQVTLRGV